MLRPRLSPTTPMAMATLPTVTATTERGLLMPRLSPTTMAIPPTVTATTERGQLRPRLGPTTMATPPTVTATTERGLLMPRPRLSPTMPMDTPPTVTATTERGLLRPRLSPTTMATPPMATPTMVKIVQPIIDLITTSNHRACFNNNLVTITYQKMFCSLQ